MTVKQIYIKTPEFKARAVQQTCIQRNSDTCAHNVSKKILKPTVQGWVLFLGLR